MKHIVKLYTSANPDLTFTYDDDFAPVAVKSIAFAVLEELPGDCDARADFDEFRYEMATMEESTDESDASGMRTFVYYANTEDENLEGEAYLVTVTPEFDADSDS